MLSLLAVLALLWRWPPTHQTLPVQASVPAVPTAPGGIPASPTILAVAPLDTTLPPPPHAIVIRARGIPTVPVILKGPPAYHAVILLDHPVPTVGFPVQPSVPLPPDDITFRLYQ